MPPLRADPVMRWPALYKSVRYRCRVQVHGVRECAQQAILIEHEGPGASLAERPLLGDPFRRLWASRSRATGPGLSIARAVATLHGGQLALSSRLTGGLRAIVPLHAD
jgi:signal transduction histidine kinase